MKIINTMFIIYFIALSIFAQTNISLADDYPVHDRQIVTQGNLTFGIDNKGMIGYDYDQKRSSFEYPTMSGHNYLSGSGFYFLYQKKSDASLKTEMVYSFDLFSGSNQFAPGRFEDGDLVDTNLAEKYQLYLKTNFKESGIPIEKSDYYWSLWNTGNSFDYRLGKYIHDIEDRRISEYPEGPSFPDDLISFCTYKSTDPRYSKNPIGLQIEQRVFAHSEENGEYLIIVNNFMNTSNDTLYNCYFAPAFDIEIGDNFFPRACGENDRCRLNNIQSDFLNNYAAAWSDSGATETGNYGYIGFAILSSPITNENGDIEELDKYKDVRSQIGINSFLQLKAQDSIYNAYHILSALEENIKINEDPFDQKILISSKRFNLPPFKQARLVTIIAVANSESGEFASDRKEEMAKLEDLLDSGGRFWFTELLTTVDEKQFTQSSVLYPNPVNNLIYIEAYEQIEEVLIVDLLGRELSTKVSYSGQETELNVRNLNKGTYFAIIKYSKRTEVMRFIKN